MTLIGWAPRLTCEMKLHERWTRIRAPEQLRTSLLRVSPHSTAPQFGRLLRNTCRLSRLSNLITHRTYIYLPGLLSLRLPSLPHLLLLPHPHVRKAVVENGRGCSNLQSERSGVAQSAVSCDPHWALRCPQDLQKIYKQQLLIQSKRLRR